MMNMLGLGICTLAILILLIAAIGIVRLPDALSRQHAATKAGTLGVLFFALGLGLVVRDFAWTWRLITLVTILLVTLPLASHALARAGMSEQKRQDEPLI
jgi:multicomponent Na+:H+ antiporter subunit G